MLYRILTEDKNEPDVRRIVGAHFPGFTLYHAVGYYKGMSEKALVIEVSGDSDIEPLVHKAARIIGAFNNQQEVLVQSINAGSVFLVRDGSAHA